MWKHEILEASSVIDYNSADIIDALRRSTQFFFGDGLQFLGKPDRRGYYTTEYSAVKPPFPITLVTYTESTSKLAALCIDNGTDYKLHGFAYSDKNGDWVKIPGNCTIYENKSDVWVPDYIQNYKIGAVRKLSDSEQDTFIQMYESMTLETLTMLDVLNTCNIIRKCKMPPTRINKKRIKHNHEPYDKYYILEVVKGVPKEKYQGEVSWDYKSPEEVAFHMCRGHFKTYTEDAPLFGKYAGTFWWQPQARGKAENGTITKDYSVVVNE